MDPITQMLAKLAAKIKERQVNKREKKLGTLTEGVDGDIFNYLYKPRQKDLLDGAHSDYPAMGMPAETSVAFERAVQPLPTHKPVEGMNPFLPTHRGISAPSHSLTPPPSNIGGGISQGVERGLKNVAPLEAQGLQQLKPEGVASSQVQGLAAQLLPETQVGKANALAHVNNFFQNNNSAVGLLADLGSAIGGKGSVGDVLGKSARAQISTEAQMALYNHLQAGGSLEDFDAKRYGLLASDTQAVQTQILNQRQVDQKDRQLADGEERTGISDRQQKATEEYNKGYLKYLNDTLKNKNAADALKLQESVAKAAEIKGPELEDIVENIFTGMGQGIIAKVKNGDLGDSLGELIEASNIMTILEGVDGNYDPKGFFTFVHQNEELNRMYMQTFVDVVQKYKSGQIDLAGVAPYVNATFGRGPNVAGSGASAPKTEQTQESPQAAAVRLFNESGPGEYDVPGFGIMVITEDKRWGRKQ